MPEYRLSTERPRAPSILRTCKQIHSEASLILYSEILFLVAEPDRILEWLAQIGRRNTKHLKRLHMFVDPVYDSKIRSFWYKLLERLARETTRLQSIDLYWDAEEAWGHYGAGKDLQFVRKVATIPRPQRMTINGFYALHRGRYLAEKMGARIEERDCVFLQLLRKYQRGTENLVP